MKRKSRIVVITGKSASGKTILTNWLMLALKNVGTIRSTTTRAPRADDSTLEYEYVSFEEFQRALANGEFVSWRKSSIDPDRKDDLYSVRLDRIQEALEGEQTFVRSLTPDTIKRWHDVCGDDVVFIHLAAPEEDEARRRMTERGGMTHERIEERIAEEMYWDEDIYAMIKSGIPIHVIQSGLSPEEVGERALWFISPN